MKTIKIIALVTTFLTIVQANEPPLMEHKIVSSGENCSDENVSCDYMAGLKCINGICECLEKNSMVLEESTGTCALLIGEQCNLPIQNFFIPRTKCVEHSECSEDRTCRCIGGWIAVPNGTCIQIPGKTFGQNCSDSEEEKCSSLAGLTCINGTCQCSSNSTEFSHLHHHCVGKIGESCIRQKCADIGSICAENNTCICREDIYTAVRQSNLSVSCQLKKTYGENCETHNDCMNSLEHPLKCYSGTCECDKAKNLTYNDEKKLCVGKAGANCYNDLCTENAHCSIEDLKQVNIFFGKEVFDELCICDKTSFVSDTDGKCRKRYQGKCSSSEECASKFVCNNGFCSCKYSSVQRFTNGKCLGVIDAPCTSDSNCGTNMVCKLFKKSSNGSCQCEDGFVESSGRKCKAPFGSKCKRTGDCDELAWLLCIDGKCECPKLGVLAYNSTTRGCIGLVGAPCGSEVYPWPCTANAECTQKVTKEMLQLSSFDYPKFRLVERRCQCKKGSGPTASYGCEDISDASYDN